LPAGRFALCWTAACGERLESV